MMLSKIFGSSSLKKFLTNIPANTLVHSTDFIYLYFIYDGANQLKAKLTTTGGAATSIETSLTTITNKLAIIKLSTFALSFNPSAETASIALYLSTNHRVSEIITFKLQQGSKCGTRILFKNRLGGYDAFTLLGIEERKNNTSKSYYKKQLPISYSKGQRGYVVSDKRTERQLSVSSQFLSNDEMAWLAELNESTDVFLIESNQYIPVHEASTDGYLESASLRKLTFNCILPTNK